MGQGFYNIKSRMCLASLGAQVQSAKLNYNADNVYYILLILYPSAEIQH